jgi:hypothetical protein
LERQKEQESNSNGGGDDDGTNDDNDDDGVSNPTDVEEESVNAGGIADFLEAEANINAIKSFVRKERYPHAVLDHLSSIVHNMRTHWFKKGEKMPLVSIGLVFESISRLQIHSTCGCTENKD